MELISSWQNPKIKQLVRLQAKARERREQQLVVVEGAREITIALNNGYVPEQLFVCEEVYAKSDYQDLLPRLSESRCVGLTRAVFEKLAYREGSDGVLALLRPKSHRLDDLKLSANPFLIVLEAVEKPGNLGAILRTADAARADAVIVCDPLTDIYNPNVVRSSIGCLFSVPVAVCSSQEALTWMHERGIKAYAAELQAASWYHHQDFRQPSAVVMGTEADGLSAFWLQNADARIKIPMRGLIDSLNVSVSTAILTFEAMRQRDFK
ncbi:MAG: RNA methyltransferase [Bacteroidales bacterium]|nr:RNA methyltransferase [Bacteroidales bacterium]